MVVSRCWGIGPPAGILPSGLLFCWPPTFRRQPTGSPRHYLETRLTSPARSSDNVGRSPAREGQAQQRTVGRSHASYSAGHSSLCAHLIGQAREAALVYMCVCVCVCVYVCVCYNWTMVHTSFARPERPPVRSAAAERRTRYIYI